MEKLAFDFLVNSNNSSYYEDYKNTIAKDKWPRTYTELKKALYKDREWGISHVLGTILVKEKDFDELLELIKKFPNSVTDYQKYFIKSHPGDIFALHMINIRRSAEHSSNRKEYKRVCEQIRLLKSIGGMEEARLLIDEFQSNYNQRPAFLDELSKIK